MFHRLSLLVLFVAASGVSVHEKKGANERQTDECQPSSSPSGSRRSERTCWRMAAAQQGLSQPGLTKKTRQFVSLTANAFEHQMIGIAGWLAQ